jgi:DNA primase
MPNIRIRELQVDVDIEHELRKYPWERDTWNDEKLIAVSPFREEKSPSFFCNLDGEYAGTWKDSGSFYEEWAKGDFTKLLSFLRNETYDETADYLLNEYTTEYTYDEEIVLKMPRFDRVERKHLPKGWMQQYAFRHPYLGNRGISEEVQQLARIGYCKQSNAVVIPWYDGNNRLANAKFRTVKGKTFWYAKDGVPIKHSVYNINHIYKYGIKEAVLCEAEIDALSWLQIGIPAIALGGSTFTEVQAEIILRSPLESIVIARDNDAVGNELQEKVINRLQGLITLKDNRIQMPYKDANEALKNGKLWYNPAPIALSLSILGEKC